MQKSEETVNNLLLPEDQDICLENGQEVETARLTQRLSQSVLANMIGITPNTYQKLVKGQTKLSTLVKARRVLGLSTALKLDPKNQSVAGSGDETISSDEDDHLDSEW